MSLIPGRPTSTVEPKFGPCGIHHLESLRYLIARWMRFYCWVTRSSPYVHLRNNKFCYMNLYEINLYQKITTLDVGGCLVADHRLRHKGEAAPQFVAQIFHATLVVRNSKLLGSSVACQLMNQAATIFLAASQL